MTIACSPEELYSAWKSIF